MTDKSNGKQISPGVAAAIGAVVGAVGAGAAIALSDKKTRDRMKGEALKLKSKGEEKLGQIKSKLDETSDQIEKGIKGGTVKLKHMTSKK